MIAAHAVQHLVRAATAMTMIATVWSTREQTCAAAGTSAFSENVQVLVRADKAVLMDNTVLRAVAFPCVPALNVLLVGPVTLQTGSARTLVRA